MVAQLAEHRLATSLRFQSFSYQEGGPAGQAVRVDTKPRCVPLSSNDRVHVHISKLEDAQPS